MDLSWILQAAGSVALAVASFLIGRWWTGARHSERLANTESLLNILANMRALGIGEDRLREMESQFKQTQQVRDQEDKLTIESYRYGVDQIDAASCQSEMNIAQHRRLQMLDAKLKAVLTELDIYLDEDDKDLLKSTQRAWLKYRELESGWAARAWGGGSMAPFIESGEASRLTVARIASLEAALDEAREAFAHLSE